MNKPKHKLFALFAVILIVSVPSFASAQTSINAKAYVLLDASTKQIIASSNANLSWTPASLTKLVTALVVLDTKPNLSKSFAINSTDQSVGQCGRGGDCVKAISGTKFTVDGLFHAALLPSANNAANALSRSTGLSKAAFVKKMNAKAKALGATHSKFYEPTGISPSNKITAADYAKIVAAAFANPYLKDVAQQSSFYLKSTNNSKYSQTIRNTNALVDSAVIDTIGAKTGYLPQSRYNFATKFNYNSKPYIVVVLGEPHMWMAYDDTKYLASLTGEPEDLALVGK